MASNENVSNKVAEASPPLHPSFMLVFIIKCRSPFPVLIDPRPLSLSLFLPCYHCYRYENSNNERENNLKRGYL